MPHGTPRRGPSQPAARPARPDPATLRRTRLATHPWPGNVRELRTTLLRAALFAAGDRIDRADVDLALLPSSPTTPPHPLTHPLGDPFDLPTLLREVRQHYVQRALAEAAGVKARAARLLGVTLQTFQDWL